MPEDKKNGKGDASSGASPDPNSKHPFASMEYQLNTASKRWLKKYRTEFSASSASLLSTLIAYPLDSIKSRMQAYNFKTSWTCARHTYNTEGVHGFWRGTLAPLASVTLVRTVSFSIYQRAKYSIDEWMYLASGTSPLEIANTRGALPTLSTMTCFGISGAAAGAAVTAIACPFELTKLSAQFSVLMANNKGSMSEPTARPNHLPQHGTLKTAMNLVKQRGPKGLYHGFQLHLLRDTTGTAIYFMSYESCKQLLANARGNSPTAPGAVALAGGFCGIASWACIYPLDVAKTKYQRNCLNAEEGQRPKMPTIHFFRRRMYRGLSVSMTRSAVINAVFFSVFEASKKRINNLEVDDL
ncbi:mitochondrial carrier [Viridothelium virens]|uniref:Mitochondrial carrier n=1 Tax=Viridothelium virens TaxID=1048519 RepID=A0A6A6HBB4_VIRVR|nr:mitochondrial carrier [Viridothelium virens]